MKREDERAARLLKQMGRLVVPLPAAEDDARRHDRIANSLDRLLDELPATRARKRRVWTTSWLVAAAALVLLSIAVGRARHSTPVAAADAPQLRAVDGRVSLWRDGRLEVTAVQAGLLLGSTDELRVAPGARAVLALANQASVEVSGQTSLEVTRALAPDGTPSDERLELGEGRVTLSVPKLAAGHTLRVRTPDALVTVRGTRFSVATGRAAAGGSVTRVTVTEGHVAVASGDQSRLLGPGEEWVSPGSTAATSASAPSPAPASAAENAGGPPVASAPHAEPVTATAAPSPARRAPAVSPTRSEERADASIGTSTLAEETRRYEDAMRLARAGKVDRALVALESLMHDRPRTPLLQSARVEHLRLLSRAGNQAAAAREARSYLSDYPTGFARAEAKQMALFGLAEPP